jgi:hypothetical protein
MAYVPTPGPLEGEQFIPSNGDQGYSFIEEWCSNCQRDKALREGVDLDECDDNEKCEIVAASFRGEAVEWRELANGKTKCIAFVPAGQIIPAERCPHTAELPFGGDGPAPIADECTCAAKAMPFGRCCKAPPAPGVKGLGDAQPE